MAADVFQWPFLYAGGCPFRLGIQPEKRQSDLRIFFETKKTAVRLSFSHVICPIL